jgi:hypothetical protein
VRLVPLTTLDNQTAVTRVQCTGTLTSGSTTITGLSVETSALVGALGIYGSGLPRYSFVNTLAGPNSLTINQAATSSGSVALTIVIEPVMLQEAMAQARNELPDNDPSAPFDRFLLSAYIRSARLYAEAACRQSLLTQQWILYLDSFPSAGGYYNRAIREIWPSLGGLPSGLGFYPGLVPNSTGVIDIPLPPLQAVSSVQYLDFQGNTQTVSPSAYNVSVGMGGRIQPQYSTVWPISRPTIDSVFITFTAGMGPTADTVPDNIRTAILMFAAHLYENREAVSADGTFTAVPMGVQALLGVTDPGIYC